MSGTEQEAARWRCARELFEALVELPADERRTRLARVEDRALAEEVATLLAAHEGSGTLLQTPAWPADGEPANGREELPLPAGTRLGPWRIEGGAGRGGMGVVYRARRDDGAFERLAAVKVVRGVFDSRALATRLAEERRVLAPLDHPGIARLLDAGSTPEGLPYLVLEYVDGEPIDAWCERRALPLAARLALLLAVCNAVEYAHERLVLHRDLKPSNILVDREGRPHLLDFGIAKLLDPATGTDRQATLTRAGFRALSLDYASPEQLRGEPLGTASDVFSLGVVLYRLLTGLLPFAGDTDWPEARAAKVAKGLFEAPSAVARRAASGALPWKHLRGDLDAIVAKALAADRAGRYGSVGELAEDLRRHLDGRPVRAQRPSTAYRVRRFVVRHRAAVAAGVLVVLALAGATVFSLRQAANARRERDLARERFEDVRRLAKVFLFNVHDAVAPLSGSTAARELLARTGAEYLDRLALDAGDDPAFLLELATGYERLAEIQGRPFGANRGDARTALATYDKSRALFERLVTLGHPSLAAAVEALSRLDLAAAESHFALGELPPATARASTGLDRLEPAATGEAFERRLLRAQLRARLGFLTGVTGEIARGIGLVASALAELKLLATERPGDRVVRRQLARTFTDHGSLVGNSGAPGASDLALGSFERSLAIDRRLVEEGPADLDARRSLLRDHLMVGAAHATAGRLAQALPIYAEGARRAREMADADPADAEAARAEGILVTREAITLVELGRPREGLAALADTPARLDAMRRRAPDNIRLAWTFAQAASTGADAARLLADDPALPAGERAAHRRSACAAYAAAAPVLDDLAARNLLPGTEGTEARETLARRAAYCPPTPR